MGEKEKLDIPESKSDKKDVEKTKAIPYYKLFTYATTTEVLFDVFAIFMALVSGSALPFTTIIFGDLVDSFAKWQAQPFPGALITADQLASDVSSKVIFFIYLAVISFVSTYVFMATFVYTSEASCHRIRKEYLLAVMRQDIAWFDTVGAGEVSTRITNDTLLIQDGIGEKLPLAFASVATFIAGFAIAFYRSWKMTLMLLSVIPFIVVSAAIMNVAAGRFQTRISALYGSAGNIAEESISSVRTVASFNGQKKVSALYDESLGAARKEGIKKSYVVGLGLGVLMFFLYLAYSVAFWYGHILLNNNEITVGTVVNVFFAVLIGAFSLGQLAPDLQAFAFGIGAGNKIFETIERVPPIDAYDKGGYKIPKDNVEGKIELKDVEFTYPSRKEVKILKKLSLTVLPGQTVALVGQSGSGKSTIIQLLERFYDPQAGTVELDGRPLTELNLASLRQVIGLVSQEPVLFEGTVAENVAQGLVGSKFEHVTGDERLALIQDACKQANAHEFVLNLPNGYDTQVGERGMLLSGGQKQRVAIARAIIKDPKILLLDEATSALDTTSERIVQEALDNVSKTRTTIAIAHRLSTIKNADNIIVMVRGEIIEQGNHAELLATGGLYSELVAAQELETNKAGQTGQKEHQEEAYTGLKSAISDEQMKGGKDIEEGQDKEMTSFQVLIEIMKFNLPELNFTILGFISAVGTGLVYPFFAYTFASIIDAFSKKGPELDTEARNWALAFIGIAVWNLIFNFGQNAFFGITAELLTERLRKLVFKAIMRQEIAFFDEESHSTGALTSNLSTDAQKVQGASGSTLGMILQIIVNLVGSLIISFIFGWKLAAVATACLPFLVLMSSIRMAIFTYFSNKSKVAYERSAQVACESVAAIKTVQSLTRERTVYNNYTDQLVQPLKDGLKNAIFNTPLYALAQSFNFVINALVFWYGGQLIAYNGYTTKQFFTVFVAIIFGAQGIGRVFAYAPDLARAKGSGESILKLLRRVPFIDSESDKGEKIEKTEGHVKFENVKFRYPTRKHVQVLKGLNIEVKPGQFAALVGPSGCGKSTTVGLIERFYDVTGGKVTLDGKDISKLNVAAYRKLIGMVSQEPNLFDTTVKENVMFGLDYIPSQEEIETACKSANIHDFIMSLPDNYDTRVGAKGGQMSGGQKQRIAIARALIKNPKILLLDEATSALDAESEKVVQEALDSAAKGRTTIAIAHRLSTIQHADVIYVLKDGVVAEKGTHMELYAKKGIYYELAISQNLS
ncbi:GTPase-activating protein [Terramyces sp. JEL0728]|nr:GTPase-activating protein [Terramyces sp. JEL0728]